MAKSTRDTILDYVAGLDQADRPTKHVAYRPDHLTLAKMIEDTVRNRRKGTTPHAMRAQALAIFEDQIIEQCIAIVDLQAHQTRLYGCGVMLKKNKGEATDADVDRWAARYNALQEVSKMIREMAPQMATPATAASTPTPTSSGEK